MPRKPSVAGKARDDAGSLLLLGCAKGGFALDGEVGRML